MTLVVASIHDDQITIVSDTMVTHFHNEKQTRRELLSKPTLKILVVSPTIAVGLAGSLPADTNRIYQEILDSPDDLNRTINTLRDRSRRYPESFIVAALVPSPALWRIQRGGSVDGHSGRCVIGDQESYELYVAREERCKHSESTAVDETQALRMAIQYFLNIDDGPTCRVKSDRRAIRDFLNASDGDFDRTIGGYLTEIVTTPSGFRYEAHTQLTLPDRMSYHFEQADCGKMHLVAGTKDSMMHQRYTLIGGPPNRRAIGFCLPQAKTGIFYPDGEPWNPTVVPNVSSAEEMVHNVWTNHRQMLMHLPQPNYVTGHFFPE